ncbi:MULTISPECIES: NAD(P)/FAD-dependent oxidoreductase [unclassified Micromonospora]|uniref:NAD(P)/FAD-dependent oxidoreductase n=1 Tax=unclassified Micromonospora TaxID=2617518 RepID=UPI0024923A65|nr:NAD(P)/FAD-dependent oxidoreductase [Micromonospora sp. AKA38]
MVGARCAGATTALLLARAGHRVLLLERAKYPSDTLSTLYIHQSGVERLARWGLLDRIRQTGCPPLTTVSYRVADVYLRGPAPTLPGVVGAFAPRRYVLDPILAEAAAEAGVEVREQTLVTGLTTEDGRVTGVRLRTANGAETTERANLVIGADGMRSTVAKFVDAPHYAEHPNLTCVYFTYWSGIPAHFEIYERTGGWVAAVGTHDDLTLIASYLPQEQFAQVRRDPKAAYLANIQATAPPLWERLAEATMAERLYGTGDQRNFFRQAHGPGWALVGDAGHHKDSINAHGITDAFHQSELLAAELTSGDDPSATINDPVRQQAALARFASARDTQMKPTYHTNLVTARLDPDPHLLSLLRAVQDSPELTERYFSVVAGILSPEDLFTRDLLARL